MTTVTHIVSQTNSKSKNYETVLNFINFRFIFVSVFDPTRCLGLLQLKNPQPCGRGSGSEEFVCKEVITRAYGVGRNPKKNRTRNHAFYIYHFLIGFCNLYKGEFYIFIKPNLFVTFCVSISWVLLPPMRAIFLYNLLLVEKLNHNGIKFNLELTSPLKLSLDLN